jgi:alkylhydroperoxidase/carboxymuconolactone decarboxylase family protein YurZ
MLLDWKSLIPKLGRSMKELSEISPATMSGYRTLQTAGSETGHLDAKTRELISLAIAVTTRCDGCIANQPYQEGH